METKFSIINVIKDYDMVKFHEKVKEYEKDKKIIEKRISTSEIPVGSGSQMGSMTILSCYFEVECTEDAYKSWKFGQKLKV